MPIKGKCSYNNINYKAGLAHTSFGIASFGRSMSDQSAGGKTKNADWEKKWEPGKKNTSPIRLEEKKA